MVLIGIPLLIGFILLGVSVVSVGIINGQASTPDFVSMLTIKSFGIPSSSNPRLLCNHDRRC